MCLTLNQLCKSFIGLGVLLAVGATGCQTARPVPAPDKLSAQPIPVDGAMQLRTWPQTAIKYESFSVDARPTGFLWTQRYNDNGFYTGPGGEKFESGAMLSDTGIFLVDVFTLPVALIVTPPWTHVESSGGPIPPTDTAAYPLTPIR